ncbi:MAG: sigma-70 family RNA polymerase sigma factor [Bacteroidales bacterium]|nr:sigma-70 family RNA polymerase sigma factor [Bacteroidales bacterium]MBQ5978846.1 sigma-70 family RNA polymerase sigma factor [Bacteroidales bacterium]MBQ6184401.1 sigma-70 family RNA polymerase sigma factor [Bacteroidales bacterium]
MDRERETLERLRSGDKAAFSEIYKKYVSRLWRFIRQYAGSDLATDEIVQETFFRVWTHRRSIDPDKSFKSWLFKIAYNLLLKELRRQLKNPLLKEYLESISERLVNSPKKIDYLYFKEELDKAKGQLPARQKEIFEMIKEGGLSAKEVSARLSIKEQVVRNQLSSALKSLRLHLGHMLLLIIILTGIR